MIERVQEHGRRTEQVTAAMRGLVAVLIALHVGLVADELADASILWIGIGCVALLVVSAVVAGLASVRVRAARTMARISWSVAATDAVALVFVARITVAVDPSATLAWTFVLWAPFSIAIRHRPVSAALGIAGVALLIPLAEALDVGQLEAVPFTWSGVVIPMLLVVFAGAATMLATQDERRTGRGVRQALRSEQDRALRLLEADDLKNTFLAAVSHELRTPLTSILGFAMTMLDRPDLDEAQRRTMLELMLLEAEQIEDLVANLIDLDRLTRGKVDAVRVAVDPSVVVERAVANVERRAGRAVGRSLELGIRAELDPAKVQRIVENLVGNAMKYTDRDCAVEVSLGSVDGGVRIRVDDSGPGISHDLRGTIFEPFRRGADVGVPGTGIGLSLVDRFSRMHDGHASVGDSPLGGCRFEVFLAAPNMSVGGAGLTSTVDGVGSSS